MPEALGGVGKLGGGQAIDAVVGLLGDARAGVGDAGEMHHGLDALEQRAPFDRAGQIGHRHHLDRARKHVGRLPHRRANRIAEACKLGDQSCARRSPTRR